MKKIIFPAALAFLLLYSCSPEPKDKIKEKNLDPKDRMMEEMEKNKSANTKPKDNPYKNAKLDIKVFNNDSLKQENNPHGYGYDIYMFDAMYVHQPNIPAINGNRGFHTREQARKTAEMVLYKIRNNIMPPSLSIEELDSLQVLK